MFAKYRNKCQQMSTNVNKCQQMSTTASPFQNLKNADFWTLKQVNAEAKKAPLQVKTREKCPKKADNELL